MGCGEHAAIVRRLRYETTAVCVLRASGLGITVPIGPCLRGWPAACLRSPRIGAVLWSAGEAPVYERLTKIVVNRKVVQCPSEEICPAE